MRDARMNWARNITFGAPHLHRPTSVAELQKLVATASHARALGTGHSFNTIADSVGDQVSLADMPPSLAIDAERKTVTVGAGVRYGELAAFLHGEGYALHNLGSLPHISVAGACATGTHGSGVTNGNLATAVRAIEMVTATGDLVTLGTREFPGAVVALGMLGIVSSMTLAIEPTYEVAQYVYDDLPFSDLQENLDEILSAAYSVSVFTDWRGPLMNAVWLKYRVGSAGVERPEPHWMGARLADGPRHPVPHMPVENCTQQLGVPGPWHERLPHFRLDFTPSNGEELQTEYFVARTSAHDALDALNGMRERIAPVLQITELRTIAADDLWLSPAYGRDSFAMHFTWIKDHDAVAPVVAEIEEKLAPFDARPHWGKVFTTSPDVVRRLYDRLPDFSALAAHYDPAGKFRNEFVDRYV
ncbi:MAG TPA: FAD-binding protein [Acidothermaceae bacterium]|jgi:xylitol oxidase|nr:FAD-binding protein [Acidothermaceae bacterium]